MTENGRTIPQLSIDTQLIYDKLKTAAIGDLVTYSDMSAIVGRDVQKSAYANMHSAVRMCLRERILFEPIRGRGLKRLTDSEIVGTGISTMKKIRRSASKGALKLASVNKFDELTKEEQVKHNSYLSIIGALRHFSDSASVKKIESAVQEKNQKLPWARTLEAFKG